MPSENGWNPAKAAASECEWVRVPGTNVTLQILKGWPLRIMPAFAADYNAYVEPLRDADSAAWTPTNSVATSNHLNGTAMDLNWNGADGKTFRLGISEAAAYPGEKAKNLRDLLDFYEGMIFCGGNWSIRDWMHFQMGGNTWNNPRTQDFINRKIRADGFSTYRRGATPSPVPGTYGLPTGTRINYGAPGFPDWVYQLASRFNIRASTYPGHQENHRDEAGFAPNHARLNRGIDWAGAPNDMQQFAEYCLSIRNSLEQVIWQNPNTGQRIGVAGGKDVSSTNYYADNYAGHRDHVHTRQSAPLPLPGGTPPVPSPPPPIQLTRAERYALRIIREGQKRKITPRGIKIALSVAIVESSLQMYANVNVPESLAKNPDGTQKYPHDKVGSDHDSLGLFQQRSPMWGQPSCLMNVECSAGLFYDRLVKLNYNDPNRTPGSFAADIQRPAAQYRDRYQQRFSEAEHLYNRLLALPGEEDELSAEAERKIAELHEAFFGPPDFESISPLREPGEGKVGNLLEFIRWMDANVHIMVELMLVKLRFPDPDAVALLQRVATNNDPRRERDRKLARAILLETQSADPAATIQVVHKPASPPAVFTVDNQEPEVLPAIREPTPVQNTNTPEALLDTIDRLNIFQRDFEKRMSALKSEEKE